MVRVGIIQNQGIKRTWFDGNMNFSSTVYKGLMLEFLLGTVNEHVCKSYFKLTGTWYIYIWYTIPRDI